MTPREFIDFLHLAERLKDNTRHSTTSQGPVSYTHLDVYKRQH